MDPPRQLHRPGIPRQALLISGLAVAIPAAATLFFPEILGVYEVLLWLVALAPAFLLAYHRGWRGVAGAVLVALVVLTAASFVASGLGRTLDRGPLFIGVILALLAVGFGVAVLAELIHRERGRAESAALTDALTGLPNRRYVDLILPREFAGAERDRALTVVLFDLDHFKGFNDRFGHAAGDEALRRFAAVLVHHTRRMNLSARWGGEEFITILSSTTDTGAVVFAQRVRTALAEHQPHQGTLTVTAGVAQFRTEMESPQDLLAAADSALYQAKADGRDRVGIYRPEGSPASAKDESSSGVETDPPSSG